jgi:hypothetical protein
VTAIRPIVFLGIGVKPALFMLGVFAGLGALALVLTKALTKVVTDKTGPVWQQLARVAGGSVEMSSLTYTGSRLTGNYRGLPIRARVGADKNMHVGYSTMVTHDYYFEVEAEAGAGGRDWSLLREGGGAEVAADEPLRQALQQAGLPAAADGLPDGALVSYEAADGRLRWRTPIAGPAALPAPDAFARELDATHRMAEINRQINK